jgi:hypothetical protein
VSKLRCVVGRSRASCAMVRFCITCEANAPRVPNKKEEKKGRLRLRAHEKEERFFLKKKKTE